MDAQRQLLETWGIAVHQVGSDWGRKGVKDENIIVRLRDLRNPTFFTRDAEFYDWHLCHLRYCVVVIAAAQYEVASFVRRFLRHPGFKTQAKRMGKVVRISARSIAFWELHRDREASTRWPGF